MNAYTPVLEFAHSVHARANLWKALAMLNAYFDESGTDGPITAIAGLVGTADAWSSLETQWVNALSRVAGRPISWFHMTDCLAGDKQFAGISTAERGALIAYLTGISAEHDVHVIWCGVNAQEFDRLTTPQFRVRYPKPYDLCFDDIVGRLADWSRNRVEGSQVNIVFAEQAEYKNRNDVAYAAWKAHPQFNRFLGPLTYATPQQLVPLQSADLVVHQVRREWEGLEFKEVNLATNFQIQPSLDRITHSYKRISGGFYGTMALKNTIRGFHVKKGEPSPFPNE